MFAGPCATCVLHATGATGCSCPITRPSFHEARCADPAVHCIFYRPKEG